MYIGPMQVYKRLGCEPTISDAVQWANGILEPHGISHKHFPTGWGPVPKCSITPRDLQRKDFTNGGR